VHEFLAQVAFGHARRKLVNDRAGGGEGRLSLFALPLTLVEAPKAALNAPAHRRQADTSCALLSRKQGRLSIRSRPHCRQCLAAEQP
jgi:hypothetical protein